MNIKKLTAALLCVLLLGSGTGCKEEEPYIPAPPETTAAPIVIDEPMDTTDYALLTETAFEGVAIASEEELTFTEGSDGICITAYTGSSKKVSIPSAVGGKTVVAIAENAFAGQTELSVLCLPETLLRMEKGCLAECTSLHALKTPLLSASDGETQYLGYLFGADEYESNSPSVPRTLEFLVLNGRMTELSPFALYNCSSLVSVRLPDTLTKVGKYAFYNCSSLRYTDFETLSHVGLSAFRACSHLERVTFSERLERIESEAFLGCVDLRAMTLPFVGESRTENTYLGYIFGAEVPDFSKGFYPSRLSEITLLPGCTALGNYAFYECSALSDVTLPEGLVSIGVRAFESCYSLRTISFPSSLASIRENAFFFCSALSEVSFPTDSVLTQIGINAFYKCRGLTRVTLPASLSYVPASCFADCTALSHLDLGGAREIDAQAFRNCTALAEVKAGATPAIKEGNEALEAFFPN